MANNLNIDYAKDNEFLPQNIRAFIGDKYKIIVQEFDTFFTLFTGIRKRALWNNFNAAKFACGWTILNMTSLQSGVAPRLLKIKCDKTVGKLFYQAKDDKEAKVDEIFPKDYVSKKINEAAKKSSMTGRCAIALYAAENQKPYIICYDAFRHQLEFDDKGDVLSAELYINKLDNPASIFSYYFIIEKRYYKDGKPYQRIGVTYQAFSIEHQEEADATYELETKDIPDWLKEQFKDIKFNREQELQGFTDLGVYHWDETAFNAKFPDIDIPEAMFVDALDTIVTVENGLTDKEIEKEIGRGQVLIPEFGKGFEPPMVGNVGFNQSAIAMHTFAPSGKKNPIVRQYPSVSMDKQSPLNVQFDFRPDQWALSINEDICRLCAIVGIGVIDYDSRLLGGGSQRTDDEINAMTDITRQTVEASRNLNEPEINKLLACLSALYGLPQPVKIRWSMASIINPTKNAARIQGLYAAGLISKKQALRELYPDLMESEINDLYAEIQKETSYNPEEEIIRNYENF